MQVAEKIQIAKTNFCEEIEYDNKLKQKIICK